MLFRKRLRSKKADLSCPYCKHLQQESAYAMSTFCRSCGEYFRIRKGVAFAPPGLRVSGISEIVPFPVHSSPALAASEQEARLSEAEQDPHDQESIVSHLLPHQAMEDEAPSISAGAFFGLVKDPSEHEEDAADSLTIGSGAQSRSSLGEGSIAALIETKFPRIPVEKEKMPPNYLSPDEPQGRESSVPEAPVRCFQCYHIQNVSIFAKSTQCERCSAYISMASFEIKTVKSHTLRTRGNVTITKKGGLIDGSEIVCHHLHVNGAIDAVVDCSGDAVFRHSGTVRGKLYCEKLVIEKLCEVRFPDGVMTNSAEISGHLIGDLTCSGTVRLSRTGVIQGDLHCADLDSKEGAHIAGETRIDPETNTVLPLRKGFNPSVIS